MKFRFSDEHGMLRRTAGVFAARELSAAYLRELDVHARAPHRELLPKMAAVGFTALTVPPEYGGVGGNALDAAVLLEELGRTSLAAAAILNAAIGFGCELINHCASDAQKRGLLPKVVRGEVHFACAVAEHCPGSDATFSRVHAAVAGENFIINGGADVTSGGPECGRLIVAARIDSTGLALAQTAFFVIDSDTPGIELRKLETLGMRGTGGLYQVNYSNVRAPRSALLALPPDRPELIQDLLEREMVCQAAYCIGGAQQVVDHAVRYAGERKQFGQAIGKFQAISHLLADLQVEVDAARWLMYRAAWRIAGGAHNRKEAAMANLACSEALLHASADCMRVYGGYGLTLEFDIQRHFRDAHSFIGENGARQMQRNQIAHAMGLERENVNRPAGA